LEEQRREAEGARVAAALRDHGRRLADRLDVRKWCPDLDFLYYAPAMNSTGWPFKFAVTWTVIAAAAAFAPNAGAQAASEEQAGATFRLPFGAAPSEIFGVPCKLVPGNADFAPSVRCNSADPMKQPSIAISVADWKSHPSRAEMIANFREAFHERSIFNAIREENFAPPDDPEAVGFRALYQTDLGNRYVWTVLSKGKMIRVLVTAFAPADFAAMTADIEWKIFVVPRP